MNRSALLCLLLSIGLFGAEAEAARRATKKKSAPPAIAHKAVKRAAQWVGLPSIKSVSREVTDDCSGLMRLAYWRQDLSLFPERTLPGENGVAAIHRKARDLKALRTRPRAGYLVFFQETHDRNGDGRRNDGLTHIGIVERVERSGTVTFVHRAGGGVKRGKFNLRSPDQRRDARGRVLNDYLRRPDDISEIRLAGQLVTGFATVDERWKAPAAKARPARASRSKSRR